MINIVITLLSILLTALYFIHVIIPVKLEQQNRYPINEMEAWKDFILSCINSSRDGFDLVYCTTMITLFEKKFTKQHPAYIIKKAVDNLTNRLDTKLALIESEEQARFIKKVDRIPVLL